MSTLLHINASARHDESYSLRTSRAFIEAWLERTPDGIVETWNLHEDKPPDFGELASKGKYAIMKGETAPPEATDAWSKVERTIERFKKADLLVFSVPMWNFGIPYVLKQLIDVIVQPGYTFRVDSTGYHGLLTSTKAFVSYARGGSYDESSGAAALDHQKPYFDQILGFMGIKAPASVVIEPTMAGREKGAEVLEQAMAKARDAARLF